MFKKSSDCYAQIMTQIQDVERCLLKFEAFMRAATSADEAPNTLLLLSEDIAAAEDTADKSLRALIEAAGKGSYLPSTREDMIEIATGCDKIANKCENVAYLVMMYGLKFPEAFRDDFNTIFDITEKQFKLLETAVGMLFSKLYAFQKDHSILDEIRTLETQIDKLEKKIGQQIFAMDMELAAKMQLFELVGKLCDISDIIENMADKLQIMLIARKA